MTIILVDGKPHRFCDCDPQKGECPRGVKRDHGTHELARCLVLEPPVPAPENLLAWNNDVAQAKEWLQTLQATGFENRSIAMASEQVCRLLDRLLLRHPLPQSPVATHAEAVLVNREARDKAMTLLAEHARSVEQCHATEDGDWGDEHSAKEYHDELMATAIALSAA